MNECLQSANWLSRSLDQRAQTIIKVATEIVKHQQEFFDKGVQHLKPLNLKTIAEAVGMHESTISRVTSNKYIMTPRGLFELKYFFTVSIGGVDGLNNHSAESIRQRIKVLIDGEDVKNVLSDDNIVLLLKRENIEIARRTVAKYRESLNIASSVQRRREKKILMRVGT
jgi:RNA polymerase sigma-54 factor